MFLSDRLDRIVFLYRWHGFMAPSCYDRVEIVRQGQGFVRRSSLKEKLESVDNDLVDQFVRAILAAPIPELDIDNLGFGAGWAARHQSEAAEAIAGLDGMDDPDQLKEVMQWFVTRFEECVQGEYGSCWTNDYPHMAISLLDDMGGELRVESESQHMFMIPWQVRRQDGSGWSTFHASIGRAAGSLLGETFDGFLRLTGKNIAARLAFNAWSSWHWEREEPPLPAEPSSKELDSDAFLDILLESKRLLQDRADREQDPNAADDVGQTALMHAAFPPFNRQRFFELVAAGANVEARRKDGMSGLLLAAAGGEAEAARAWLDAGALVDGPGQEGETALMLALHGAWWEIIRELVERGANVNATDHEGSTPLMYAMTGKAYLAEEERDRWCTLIGDEDRYLFSGRSTAAELVRFLLEHGADVSVRDRNGCTALTYAMKKEHEHRVEDLVNRESQRAIGETAPEREVDASVSETCRLLMAAGAEA